MITMDATQSTLKLPASRDGIHCDARLVLHLVLTYHWYDETDRGAKSIEYRAMTRQWARQIWQRRNEITHVRFARGYTSTMRTFEVEKIDIGDCPIDGWDDQYYRIHFKQNAEVGDASRPTSTNTTA